MRRLMMVAFAAISPEELFPEERLRIRITHPDDYGRETDIGTVLTYGASLAGNFDDEEFAVVQDAFARFEKLAPSKQVAECCAKMILLAKRYSGRK